jgi:pimeloyl-ACP methyl ester carboxylesterase
MISLKDMTKSKTLQKGKGVPLILVPGRFMELERWMRTIDDLSRTYHVIAFDFSFESSFNDSISDHISYVLYVLKALNIKTEDCIGLGFSYGALILKRIHFVRKTLFRSLILCSSNLVIYRESIEKREIIGKELDDWICHSILRLFSEKYIKNNYDRIAKNIDYLRKRVGANGFCVFKEDYNEISQVEIPRNDLNERIYFINGTEDSIVNYISVEKRIRGSKAKQFRLNAGHVFWQEMYLDFLNILYQILDEIEGEEKNVKE